jgi:hypothetical protein
MEEGFLIGDDGVPGSGGAPSPPQSCLGVTQQAEAIGLDIFVMLDISGSMLDALPQTAFGIAPATKWDAVRTSLETFVQDPGTAEIGIGLQYFPQINAGVPFACVANDECGAGGPCTSAVCVTNFVEDAGNGQQPLRYLGPAGDTICSTDADCPGQGATCRNMLGVCVVQGVAVPQLDALPLCNVNGDCAGLPNTGCEEIGACQNLVGGQLALCTPSLGCPAGGGACTPFPYSCQNQTICDAASYATPAVAISTAATRAADIVASLRAQQPNGLTPTGPALSGALDQARAWAAQSPGRQVVTVLATDGLPTECTPVEIPNIAQLAADANSGASPVKTFVIGVFSNADLGADGRQNLDALARAGGTERAFVINTAGAVQDDFLAALNEIRDNAVSCEFQLDARAALDFNLVNLKMSDPAGNVTDLLNVGDASACGNDQGWFYVLDANGNPSQIDVCPSTCANFRTEGITAELEIGCATRIR